MREINVFTAWAFEGRVCGEWRRGRRWRRCLCHRVRWRRDGKGGREREMVKGRKREGWLGGSGMARERGRELVWGRERGIVGRWWDGEGKGRGKEVARENERN